MVARIGCRVDALLGVGLGSGDCPHAAELSTLGDEGGFAVKAVPWVLAEEGEKPALDETAAAVAADRGAVAVRTAE